MSLARPQREGLYAEHCLPGPTQTRYEDTKACSLFCYIKVPSGQLLSTGIGVGIRQPGLHNCSLLLFCIVLGSDPLGTCMHLVPTPIPTSCPLRDPGTEAGTCLLQGFEGHETSHMASSPPSLSFLLSWNTCTPATPTSPTNLLQTPPPTLHPFTI